MKIEGAKQPVSRSEIHARRVKRSPVNDVRSPAPNTPKETIEPFDCGALIGIRAQFVSGEQILVACEYAGHARD